MSAALLSRFYNILLLFVTSLGNQYDMYIHVYGSFHSFMFSVWVFSQLHGVGLECIQICPTHKDVFVYLFILLFEFLYIVLIQLRI